MSDTPKALSGSLALTSSLSRQTTKGPIGALTLTGGTSRVKQGFPPITYATMFLSGNLSLVVTKAPKPRPVSGVLNMTGTLAAQRNKPATGNLTLTGTLSRQVTKSLSGTIQMYADLFAGKSNKLNVLGQLDMSGAVTKDVGLSKGGSLILTGLLARTITKSLSGDLTLTGDILAKTAKMGLFGDLALTGTLLASIAKSLSGDLTLTGSSEYSRAKILEGWLRLNREASIELTGDLTAVHDFVREPVGALELTGTLETPGMNSGELGLSGSLSRKITKAMSLSGTLHPIGSVTRPSNYSVAVEGGLTFMRVLTTYTTPYTYENVSLLNTAASKDIEIEQGVAFRRFYRWMKSDGIPFTLSGITLEMVITTSKGDPTIIAYSPRDITITTTGFDTGVFRVDITAAKSATFDFTRANYMIVAYWASTRVRLIEGEVQLSRTLFKRLSQDVVGATAVSSTTTKDVSKTLDGSVPLTGSQTRNISHALEGSMALTGTDALSAISASVGPTGALALTGTLGTELHEA